MKIVIAPDSYKESLSATEVAQAIEKGFREIFPDAQYVSVPVADGGEGTVEAMIAATQGAERHAWVTGPLGEKVNASWGISGDGKTAFIEMAAASGLGLVPRAALAASPWRDELEVVNLSDFQPAVSLWLIHARYLANLQSPLTFFASKVVQQLTVSD